jgi:hypothetical protein
MTAQTCAHPAVIVHLSTGPECLGRTECVNCGRHLLSSTPARLAAVAVDGVQVWAARPIQARRRDWLDDGRPITIHVDLPAR